MYCVYVIIYANKDDDDDYYYSSVYMSTHFHLRSIGRI